MAVAVKVPRATTVSVLCPALLLLVLLLFPAVTIPQASRPVAMQRCGLPSVITALHMALLPLPAQMARMILKGSGRVAMELLVIMARMRPKARGPVAMQLLGLLSMIMAIRQALLPLPAKMDRTKPLDHRLVAMQPNGFAHGSMALCPVLHPFPPEMARLATTQ